MTALHFEAPGPGPWMLDASHFDRPMARYGVDEFIDGFEQGLGETLAACGAPLAGVSLRLVHGFLYAQEVPLIGSPGDAKLPPRLIFKLFMKIHPAMRRCTRRAREVFETRCWRDAVRRWDDEVHPELERRYEALRTVDISSLDDDALREHLATCREEFRIGSRWHHWLSFPAMLPTGDFIAHCHEWTDHSVQDIVSALTGACDLHSESDDLLEALAETIRRSPAVSAQLGHGERAATVLEALRGAAEPVGAAARAWLDRVEVRQVVSCEMGAPIGAEVPGLLLEHVRSAVAQPRRGARTHDDSKLAELRQAVPASHRATFDDLLDEARQTHRLRDERSNCIDNLVVGLTRRAALEAGRRLTRRGRLAAPDHAVDLDGDELDELLASGQGPDRDSVAQRNHFRTTTTTDVAPEWLNGRPAAPPPADWFPPHGARMFRAMMAYTEGMEDERTLGTHVDNEPPAVDVAPGASATVQGIAASPGRVRGTARVILSPSEFERVRDGDILIARCTMPTYNILLPLLRGVVTDRGGILSHAAIVSREYGIPSVVGTLTATKTIPDGATIVVDGDAGTVEVVEAVDAAA